MIGVILAAGKGSRYDKECHKLLDKYENREIILHVVGAMSPFVDYIAVVVAPGHEKIKRVLQNYGNVKYVVQEEPLGTGHALLCTKEALEGKVGDVLVSYGDKPLVTEKTFATLVDSHLNSKADITLATAILPDGGSQDLAGGKGRIIRQEGRFKDVIEVRDASEDIKKIKEVHAGFLCAKSKHLYEELAKLDRSNKAAEYYLTKVYSLYLEDNLPVNTVEIEAKESYDVNTVQQLAEIRRLFRTEA